MLMSYITYENIHNPHVAIHCEGCNQIRKRGGVHKYNQGKYMEHITYQDARKYAEGTGLPIQIAPFVIHLHVKGKIILSYLLPFSQKPHFRNYNLRCEMAKKKLVTVLFTCLLFLSLSCGLPAGERDYDGEEFSFTIPAGWKTAREIWGDSAVSGQEYKGLGVQEVVTIQYPAKKGKGNTFFVVAASPLEEGQTLASRFGDAYENPLPEIREKSRGVFEQGGFSGFEITYERPWASRGGSFATCGCKRTG